MDNTNPGIILLTSKNKTHAALTTDSKVLDYFEETTREFVVRKLSGTKNWWKACIVVATMIRSPGRKNCKFL